MHSYLVLCRVILDEAAAYLTDGTVGGGVRRSTRSRPAATHEYLGRDNLHYRKSDSRKQWVRRSSDLSSALLAGAETIFAVLAGFAASPSRGQIALMTVAALSAAAAAVPIGRVSKEGLMSCAERGSPRPKTSQVSEAAVHSGTDNLHYRY